MRPLVQDFSDIEKSLKAGDLEALKEKYRELRQTKKALHPLQETELRSFFTRALLGGKICFEAQLEDLKEASEQGMALFLDDGMQKQYQRCLSEMYQFRYFQDHQDFKEFFEKEAKRAKQFLIERRVESQYGF